VATTLVSPLCKLVWLPPSAGSVPKSKGFPEYTVISFKRFLSFRVLFVAEPTDHPAGGEAIKLEVVSISLGHSVSSAKQLEHSVTDAVTKSSSFIDLTI